MSLLRAQPPCRKMLCSSGSLVLVGLLILFFSPGARLRAQTDSTPGILGEVFGNDVSVIGESHVISAGASRAIEFSSGGTIVVFSGKARVEFIGGGEMDVCGPAKFTVLSSGQALTVALSFGRVHVRFGALRPITIYMPLVVATPMPIGDQPRDATIGLTNAGAMCVLAANGAVRLQNQLSGESTIVPQPSEVFVPGSSFVSLPPAIGQCNCDFDETLAPRSPPQTAATAVANPIPRERTAPPFEKQKLSTSETPSNAAPGSQPAPLPVVSSHPSAATTLPPIAYDAKSATETPEPINVATLVLAQQTVVQPEWIFHGTVVDAGTNKNHPPGESPVAQNAAIQPRHKKRSFWAKLRHFFTGSS